MENFEAVVAPRIILSDNVIREGGTNKLSLIGCFEAFLGNTFPFQSIPFFVSVSITNVSDFRGPVNVVIRMETTAGHVIASSQAQLSKKPDSPAMPRHGNIEIVFPFQSVRFDSPGVFDLVCLVSNEILARRQFEVKSMTVSSEEPPK